MLKNTLIAVLFLALIASILFGLNRASRIDSGLKKVAIAEQERDEARAAESRARESLKSVRDSLEQAMIVMMASKIDAERAKIETVKAREELKNLVFHSFHSDKERDSVLRKLYPSFR